MARNVKQLYMSGLVKAPQAIMVACYSKHGEGSNVGDLIDATGVGKAHVSTLLRQMEARGTIEKSSEYRDKRKAVVYLSAEGEKAAAGMLAAIEKFYVSEAKNGISEM
jgi:DNA-binding MarR family transcriptional regulator